VSHSNTIDKLDVTEVLTRYAVACDERDEDAVRALFHPEATALYDVDADLRGNAEIASWVVGATAHLRWQQHGLRVMRVDLDSDHATAVGYLTSHQVPFATPDTTLMMNSRYDAELERVGDTWLIRRLSLVVGTIEHRPVTLGQVAAAATQENHHV
jgi:ketosteroid isomerase-like protein